MTDTTRHNMEVASLCERVDKVLERVLTSSEANRAAGTFVHNSVGRRAHIGSATSAISL